MTSQSAAQDAIEPDQPDVTNGSHLVTPGVVQIEAGGLYSRVDQESAFGTPVTVRIGLTRWIEARVGSDGILRSTNGDASVTGVGNVLVAAKIRLWPDADGKSRLSIIPAVNIPTADPDKGFGSGSADYALVAATGTDLGQWLHTDVNYGIGAIGSGDGQAHFVQQLISVSTSLAVADNVSPYFEGYWYSRQEADGSGIPAVDAGVTYLFTPRLAIDGGVQVSWSGGSSQFSAFGGISIATRKIFAKNDARSTRASAVRPARR